MKPLPYRILNGSREPVKEGTWIENPRHRPQEGIFETMLWEKGEVFLLDAHFRRLQEGLSLIGLGDNGAWAKPKIMEEIRDLLSRGGEPNLARLRLHVFRRPGGKASEGEYSLEAWALAPQDIGWNPSGYRLGWGKAPPRPSRLSGYKFSPDPDWDALNLYCRQKGWDDVIRCEDHGITETPIANLFLIEGEQVLTPSLDQGGVKGLMREWIIQAMHSRGRPVIQSPVSLDRLLQADGVFLTNAVRRIQWVHSIGDRRYSPDPVLRLYEMLLGPVAGTEDSAPSSSNLA